MCVHTKYYSGRLKIEVHNKKVAYIIGQHLFGDKTYLFS